MAQSSYPYAMPKESPLHPAQAENALRWKGVIAFVMALGLAGWCVTGWMRPDDRPSLTLPDGTTLYFHSLTIGTPETHKSGSGNSYTHYRHPSLAPPQGWWSGTKEWILSKLPDWVLKVLPSSWRQITYYILSDAFDLFGRHPNPKYRFVFEVAHHGLDSTQWELVIAVTNPKSYSCMPRMWGGADPGTGTLTFGGAHGTAPPVAAPAAPVTWVEVYCDDVPEAAKTFRLELRRKPARGEVDNTATTYGLSFQNPLPSRNVN